MVGYLSFRLAVDFLKPDVRFGGLSSIQWVALLTLSYYARDVVRWVFPASNQRAVPLGP